MTLSEILTVVMLQTTRVMGLSGGEGIATICFAFLTQHQRVTDRPTGGQTDKWNVCIYE